MKHGFTLIELLAVIVILAIIATIATPIVLNIIKDAKKSSNTRGAENYIHAVELSLANNELNNNNFMDGIYDVEKDNIKVNGKKPTKGWYRIESSKVTDYKFVIGDIVIEKYKNNVMVDSNINNYEGLKEYKEFNLMPTNDTNEFKIDYVSISYLHQMKINFYVKSDLVETYSDFKLNITNSYYDSGDNFTFSKNKEINSYYKKGEYYVFSFEPNGLMPYLFGNYAFKITGVLNNQSISSKEYNYSFYEYTSDILNNGLISNENNKILIDLLNVANYYQKNWLYYPSVDKKTSYSNLLLKENIITDLNSNIYNETFNDLPTINSNFINNDDNNLLDKNYRIAKTYYYTFPFNIEFCIANAAKEFSIPNNTTLEEFKKYGVLVYDYNSVNNIIVNASNYNAIDNNTNGVKIIPGTEEGYGTTMYTNRNCFNYTFDLQNLLKPIYYKLYYRDDIYGIITSKTYINSFSIFMKSNLSSQSGNTLFLLNSFIKLAYDLQE